MRQNIDGRAFACGDGCGSGYDSQMPKSGWGFFMCLLSIMPAWLVLLDNSAPSLPSLFELMLLDTLLHLDFHTH